MQPRCSRRTEHSQCHMSQRKPSLFICDATPYTCLRLGHGQFLVPSDSLESELRHGSTFKLRKKALLDKYSMDEDDLLHVFSHFDGRPQAIIGSGPISSAEYIHYLQGVGQAGGLYFWRIGKSTWFNRWWRERIGWFTRLSKACDIWEGTGAE